MTGITTAPPLADQVGYDFFRNLQALETMYQLTNRVKEELEGWIKYLLSESEVDLDVRWKNGKFFKSGAELLDKKLINENLEWLSQRGYESVLRPYQKGLNHFLHAQKRPELLSDVITEMYEAFEALAKIVTGQSTKDLSANQERFVREVKASPEYKQLLKHYIGYANNFRHAAKEGGKKPALSEREVESFVYMTGLFIRLAMP